MPGQDIQEYNRTPRHTQAFFYALFISALIFLPFVIFDGGYFIYYGDFNVQQIPFYKLAHEAVRTGDVFWNWYTDLGANFFGSYNFYLLFSPFFWLTLPFPTEWLPFLMAPLLVLKTACASFTAYFYLERFVRDTSYAVIGALLYAFSGWMDFNIFFNHFHEVAVFFPLLLLGVEKLVHDDNKGFFAVAVAVNAAVNYWFFIGEAVFVIIYMLVRMTDKGWPMSCGRFFRMAFEAVLGVGCAAAVLLPSVLALMGNPRTGVDELATGWNAWLYWHEQRLPAILQSIIFPPELPARPNFFPDHGAKWASLSAWLPMIGATGVVAYFLQRRDDWVKKLLALCFLFALVPGLNSLFILLNNSYYARWFYMPLLIMSLASVRAVENSPKAPDSFAKSIKWCAITCMAFAAACGLTPQKKEGRWKFGLASDIPLMWIYTAITISGLIVTAVIILKLRHNPKFIRIFGAGVAIMSIAFTVFFMACGKNNFERSRYIINTAINGRQQIHLTNVPFARSDLYDGSDNLLMFWHLPNIQAFHSIVRVSIMEFYPAVGVKRDVGSRPEAEFYALRSLLSVRWLFIEKNKENQSPMPGYEKASEQVGFNVYENMNYIPMGFAYDEYITREQFDSINANKRGNLLLRALLLDEDALRRNADILSSIDKVDAVDLNQRSFELDVIDRKRAASYDFYFDRTGFGAKTDFSGDKLVFFSVPFEKGWSATVNGEPAIIEKVNVGFMAVRVPSGYSEIRFNYMTPGLYEGMIVSAACIVFLIPYCIVFRKRRVKESGAPDIQKALFAGETVNLSWDEYMKSYNPEQRAENLQRALNEAASVHISDDIPEDEKTLRFRIPDEDSGNKEEKDGDNT